MTENDTRRADAYEAAVAAAEAEHAPLFAKVAELTDGALVGRVWQTGGMTMTMVFLVGHDGTEGTAPCFLGLVEGEDEETGAWLGSVGYYATEEDLDGPGVDVVDSWGERALAVDQWAEKIAERFRSLRAS